MLVTTTGDSLNHSCPLDILPCGCKWRFFSNGSLSPIKYEILVHTTIESCVLSIIIPSWQRHTCRCSCRQGDNCEWAGLKKEEVHGYTDFFLSQKVWKPWKKYELYEDWYKQVSHAHLSMYVLCHMHQTIYFLFIAGNIWTTELPAAGETVPLWEQNQWNKESGLAGPPRGAVDQ